MNKFSFMIIVALSTSCDVDNSRCSVAAAEYLCGSAIPQAFLRQGENQFSCYVNDGTCESSLEIGTSSLILISTETSWTVRQITVSDEAIVSVEDVNLPLVVNQNETLELTLSLGESSLRVVGDEGEVEFRVQVTEAQ